MYGSTTLGQLLGEEEFYWGLSGSGRGGAVSWSEFDLEDAARRARMSFVQGDIPLIVRAARISFAEMELEDEERSARISWARMRIEDSQISGFGLLVGRELVVTVANAGQDE